MPSGFAELARWANYYVIVGSSAGALTGLQFVVITLLAQVEAVGTGPELRAFGTPNVVHFCAALLISAMMSAPWDEPSRLGNCLAALGAIGFAYSLLVWRHARKATGYKPDIRTGSGMSPCRSLHTQRWQREAFFSRGMLGGPWWLWLPLQCFSRSLAFAMLGTRSLMWC